MEGLAYAAAATYREIVVGGKRYRLAAPRLGDLAALEAALLAKLPDPIEQAARAAHLVPAEQLPGFWEAAFRAAAARKFSLDALDELPEMLAAAASAFVVLRRHHGDEIATLDDAMNWVAAAFEEHGAALNALLVAAQTEGAAPGPPAAAEAPGATTR